MPQLPAQMTKEIMALVTLAVLALPHMAIADDAPPPDKSQYTLFNPVPDDLMRSFNSDRPTKSDSATTVDAGHFQYEGDIVNWTYDRYNTAKVTTSDFLVGDPTFKVGLTQNTDFELALAPLDFNQSHDRVTGAKNTAAGFGDLYSRVKFNLFGNDSGDYALAIVPYVKAPTAAHNVGNGHWEGGGYMPFTVALPDDWSFTAMTELDILENAALNGTHTNYQNLVNVGHPLFNDKVTGYVELWSDVNNDQNTPTQYTFDLAASWLVQDSLQLDTGMNIGLNKAANDFQPYLGISQRF